MNPTVGLNIGTEYFTILNHLVLGANLSTYYILGLGNGVPAIAVYPSVKYFF